MYSRKFKQIDLQKFYDPLELKFIGLLLKIPQNMVNNAWDNVLNKSIDDQNNLIEFEKYIWEINKTEKNQWN